MMELVNGFSSEITQESLSYSILRLTILIVEHEPKVKSNECADFVVDQKSSLQSVDQ